jgi:hypothetical protein
MKFIDLESTRILDRTQQHERQIFYRQVFNEGKGEPTDDVVANTEFSRLWKVLILEAAKYLQRAQSSFYPDLQSKQNVMQAVEDVRYNLSSSGTGLVNVVSPLIDAELNFVLTRILDHPEVRPKRRTTRRQLATSRGGAGHRDEKGAGQSEHSLPKSETRREDDPGHGGLQPGHLRG